MSKRNTPDEDVILGWFNQVMLNDSVSEANHQGMTLTEDPEYFQSLWDSYLNYEILDEGDKLPASQQIDMLLSKVTGSFRFSQKTYLSSTALTPIPTLRSGKNHEQFIKTELSLGSGLLPGVKFTLGIQSARAGISLWLRNTGKIPSWVAVKLFNGRELVELQNFSSDGCRFFCKSPVGKWSLVISDVSGKQRDAKLVTLRFK